jgi:hypothetical protein
MEPERLAKWVKTQNFIEFSPTEKAIKKVAQVLDIHKERRGDADTNRTRFILRKRRRRRR